MTHLIPSTHPQAQTLACQILKKGGLIICPTETVYGALVDATNPQAVQKLLAYKKRPVGKAISIACADQAMAEKYVELNSQAKKIYRTLLPGPITVVSTSKGRVVPELVSEFNTLGVRLPAYPFLLALIAQYQLPLTATSANRSGQKTPYHINDVLDHLSARQKALIDLIIDAGQLPPNPPSLVIDTTLSTPIILRENTQIETIKPKSSTQFTTTSVAETQTLAGKIILKYFSTLKKYGLLIALDGPLGAGKTTFTQGIAQFLQISTQLTSPTYTYMKEYDFDKYQHLGKLYHIDGWTIDQAEILTALKLTSIQQAGNLIVIEWYDQIKAFFRPSIPYLLIKLKTLPHDNKRQISVSALIKK